MQGGIAGWIMVVEGLAFVAAIVIIVFLIIRRIRIRKEETFEKRDN